MTRDKAIQQLRVAKKVLSHMRRHHRTDLHTSANIDTLFMIVNDVIGGLDDGTTLADLDADLATFP